jgi:hypothetical protein
MTRLRHILVMGVVIAGVVGAAASLYVVNRDPTAGLSALLAVQAGTIVALAVTVWVLLAPTVARLDDLVQALQAFARGERSTRVHPVDFAGFADIARAVNDVGASMCENDDPNLGPVQRRPREKVARRPGSDEPRPSSAASGPVRRPTSLEEVADAPGVGEVRRHRPASAMPPPKAANPSPPPPPSASPANASLGGVYVDVAVDSVVEPAPSELPAPIISGEGVSEPRVSRKQKRMARKAAATSSTLPTSVSTPPTVLGFDDAPQRPIVADGDFHDECSDTGASDSGGGSDGADSDEHIVIAAVAAAPAAHVDGEPTIIESSPPVEMPGRQELQALFEEFRREKRGAGQGDNGDLDFDAFAETILAETGRLVAEHQCRGVRFEVAVADGEVSLRPRLLR